MRATKATKAWQEATMHKYASLVSKRLKAKESVTGNSKCSAEETTMEVEGQALSGDEQEQNSATVEEQERGESTAKDTEGAERRTSVDVSNGERTEDNVNGDAVSPVDPKKPASLEDDMHSVERSSKAVHAGLWRPSPEPVQAGVHVQHRVDSKPVHVEVGRWVPVLSHQVCHLHHASGPKR